MQNEKLKVALVTPPGLLGLQDWQAILIDRLRSDPRFEVTGQIVGGIDRRDRSGTLLMRLLMRAEQVLAARRILPYDTQPAADFLSTLPVTQDQADLALALGPASLTKYQLAQLRFGEWAVAFGGMSDPFKAAMTTGAGRAPHVQVEIHSRSYEDPTQRVFRQTSYNRKPGSVLTGAFVAEKSILFLYHAMNELAERRSVPETRQLPEATREKPDFESSLVYAFNLVSDVSEKLKSERLARAGQIRESWQLGSSSGPVSGFHPGKAKGLPRSSCIMADPFLFEHQGQQWVFFEAMNAEDINGRIEVARLEGDCLTEPVTALKCTYHLSFPFVFRAGDSIFMMPETQAAKRLEIWRCTKFPDEWELHAKAFEGQYLADSSMYLGDDGRWWLITNLSDHFAFQDHSSELYLFEVDGPDLKTIKPHPKNPVVFGSDCARNAGAIIRQGDRLFRPSQNNSHGVYGFGLNLMEIIKLDETEYEERFIRQFTPKDRPGVKGMHHLSVAGGQIVMDWSSAE
ncbi:hypothetical protein DS906_20305 [Ruegeria sp. A3M17]|nr:hypothetical protein DS906_20305 [Ruegeria sp. A3M17]